MNQLNSLLIEGNVAHEPELRGLATGSSVCRFWIANNRYYKAGEGFEHEVSYCIVQAWGKLGELCVKECRKGRGVRVVGRIKQDRWEKDGVKHERVIINAEHVEFRPERVQESVREVPSGEALPEEVDIEADLQSLYFE